MPSSADSSVIALLDTVRADYPNVPFLALGQTALWDEPTKAVWRRLLDELLPGAILVSGVHDTDYFAKTSAHLGDQRKYISLPHDDGRTRDLWSAAGELSCLFGSESVPTRQMYRGCGIPFDWLAKTYPGGKDGLYADKTQAWGWRGIVSTASHSVIAHDVPILEIQDALLEQMDWGFSESLACLDGAIREQAAEIAARIRGWVTAFLADCSENCRLSDLYQALLPRFYSLLLGEPPVNFQVTASTQLFRLNSQTHHLPRFQILQTFLDSATRQEARQAYDRAISGSGSGIYTLDEFGQNALPFDVVLPGGGRGTLRLTRRGIVIETAPTPILLYGDPVSSVADLARLLEAQYGPDVLVVGKAVTLVDMIAAEYLVVFHEAASGYTGLTRSFNLRLAAVGINLPLYPLVRLTYPTWDALSAVPPSTTFDLPDHLASSFGTKPISAPDFGRRWHTVLDTQKQFLRDSRNLRRARDVMQFLEGKGEQCWCERLAEYEQALGILKEIAAKSRTLSDREAEHRDELRLWRNERQRLEKRKGEDWRTSVEPIREKIRDTEARGNDAQTAQKDLARQIAARDRAFDEPLYICRERIRATKTLLMQFRRQRRLLERSVEARQARAVIAEIVREAQMARLDLVRKAYLTIESLEHTNLRPTSWWIPLVNPSGEWFSAIVAGTTARWEPIA
jgi:hypothetical protein